MRRQFLISMMVLLALTFIGCGGDPGVADKGDTWRDGVGREHQMKTVKGATIMSKHEIDHTIAPLIDAQLDKLYEKLESLGYRGFLKHDNITVQIVPKSPDCKGPSAGSFLVASKKDLFYDGSEYDLDKDPGRVLVCAAGKFMFDGNFGNPITTVVVVEGRQVVRFNGLKQRLIVTPDSIRNMDAVYNEAEHGAAIQVNQGLYQQTEHHKDGEGHPIFGGPKTEWSETNNVPEHCINQPLNCMPADGSWVVPVS